MGGTGVRRRSAPGCVGPEGPLESGWIPTRLSWTCSRGPCCLRAALGSHPRPLGTPVTLSPPCPGLSPPSPRPSASSLSSAFMSVAAPRIFHAAEPLPPSLLAYFLSSPVFIFSLLLPSPPTPSRGIPAPPHGPSGPPAMACQPVGQIAVWACQGLCSRYQVHLLRTGGTDSSLSWHQHN